MTNEQCVAVMATIIAYCGKGEVPGDGRAASWAHDLFDAVHEEHLQRIPVPEREGAV